MLSSESLRKEDTWRKLLCVLTCLSHFEAVERKMVLSPFLQKGDS